MSLTTIISPAHLVSAYGLIGVIFIIFAETGLLFGFFFPGDSLLFLAGAYAANSSNHGPHLPIMPLLIGVSVGYFIGRVTGEKLLNGKHLKFIKPRYIMRTQEVLERYGETKAVIFARVIPIVRTFISPVVGVVNMPLKKFIWANVIGGLIWSIGVTMLGYGLGSTINIDRYILPITGVIVIISFIPILLEYRKQKAK
jgi:membrane-associated protein